MALDTSLDGEARIKAMRDILLAPDYFSKRTLSNIIRQGLENGLSYEDLGEGLAKLVLAEPDEWKRVLGL